MIPMKRYLLYPLTFSLLLTSASANASIANTSKANHLKSGPSKIILAGFLDGITDIKETVEDARDSVETTNETTTDTIDAAHETNEAVGNSREIIQQGGESQESTVIEQTEVLETTEESEATETGDSF